MKRKSKSPRGRDTRSGSGSIMTRFAKAAKERSKSKPANVIPIKVGYDKLPPKSDGRIPPLGDQYEALKGVPEFHKVKSLRNSNIMELVMKRQQLHSEITLREEQKKALTDEITFLLESNSVQVTSVFPYKVNLVPSSSSKLSKDKLLKLGVPARTIEKATVTTTYSRLDVRDVTKPDNREKYGKASGKKNA